MSPVSQVFHSVVTVRIGFKNASRMITDWLKEFLVRSTDLIQLIAENRLRQARGPVQFHTESITFIQNPNKDNTIWH